MNLSTLIGGANPYLEFAWLTSPSTTYQGITGNAFIVLTLDTKIIDAGNNGDIGSGTGITGTNTGLTVAGNQIALKAGTYYFTADVPYAPTYNTYTGTEKAIFSLYNFTDSTYVTRTHKFWTYGSQADFHLELQGQFIISSAKVFQLKLGNNEGGIVGSAGNPTMTAGGSSDDQRTTIKLWKLA